MLVLVVGPGVRLHVYYAGKADRTLPIWAKCDMGKTRSSENLLQQFDGVWI